MYQVILDPFNLNNIKSDLIEGQLCLLHNVFHIIIGLSGSTMSSCSNTEFIAMCQCFICVGKKDQAVEMYRKGIDALQKGIAVEVNYGHGKRPLLSPASNGALF